MAAIAARQPAEAGSAPVARRGSDNAYQRRGQGLPRDVAVCGAQQRRALAHHPDALAQGRIVAERQVDSEAFLGVKLAIDEGDQDAIVHRG